LHAARFEIVAWMASETVHYLIERGAGAVFCRASCPVTGSALSSLGFRRRTPTPAYWWPPNELPPAGLIHLTSLQADDAFFQFW
jgi:hypothetical protein